MKFGKAESIGLQAKGSTRKWRKIREHVLKRDHHTCKKCGKKAHHVDHIKPRRNGGKDHLPNLRAMCQKCNLSRKRV